MNKHSPTSAFALGSAALFLAACGGSQPAVREGGAASADATTVKCLGIHACKGQSQCGVPGGHACAGQNDCKGKGWIQVSKTECDAQGGKIL